jgi:hypothetical protein
MLRASAAELGDVSVSTVRRIWRKQKVQPQPLAPAGAQGAFWMPRPVALQ